MKTSEVTNELINKKVECVVTGLKTTGVVTGIIDNKWSKGVIIKLDAPVQWVKMFSPFIIQQAANPMISETCLIHI